jgi:Tfp pilus assembly protein PilN
MIKVNLLKDHSAPVEKQQTSVAAPKMPWYGFAYIAAIIIVVVVLGYLWSSSGSALKNATAENQRLERELKIMEDLRKQFVELERKKQERQSRIDIIEKLLQSQSGPVKLMNAVIQSVPPNREIWLTSLEQTNTGVKVKGSTRVPEVLPDFMNNLEKSGIFNYVDVELIERRDEISNSSILCAGK